MPLLRTFSQEELVAMQPEMRRVAFRYYVLTASVLFVALFLAKTVPIAMSGESMTDKTLFLLGYPLLPAMALTSLTGLVRGWPVSEFFPPMLGKYVFFWERIDQRSIIGRIAATVVTLIHLVLLAMFAASLFGYNIWQ